MRSADKATVIRLLILFVALYLVILKVNPAIPIALFAISLALDGVDGYLALRQQSKGTISFMEYMRYATGGGSNSGAKKIVLIIVMIGGMMAAIDSTIVILALPSIIPSLHSNLSTAIWIILAYILVLATFTTQLGKLGDLFGRAKIFNYGMLIFGMSSLFCGLAFNDIMLIVGRILQRNSHVITSSTYYIASATIIYKAFHAKREGNAPKLRVLDTDDGQGRKFLALNYRDNNVFA